MLGVTSASPSQRRCCNSLDVETYNTILLALSFVFIILTLIVVTILTVQAPTRDSVHRVAGVATADQVVGGAGEPGATYAYQVLFDWNNDAIMVRVQKLDNVTTQLTGLYIMGPLLPYSGGVAPLAGALCGAPTLACDVLSTPGVVTTTVSGSILDGVHPSGVDVRPLMEAYRTTPELYYLSITSNGVPTLPGAARGSLAQFAGFP